MREMIGRCEQVAHDGGLAAGLAAALDAADPGAAPGRVAALPSGRVAADAPLIRHEAAQREGISFVRCEPCADLGEPGAADRLAEFGARLGAVRLGVTRRLLEATAARLSGRAAGGEPLIRKQLVLGVLADVLTGVEAARRCLLVAGRSAAAVADVHDRLTALDWEVAKLLGASGYLADGPARGAYVSRLTANCWIPRGGAR